MRTVPLVMAPLVLLVGVTTAAIAQEAAPTKLGFVDVEKAVFTIKEGKARLQELQEWARPRQQQLQQVAQQITDLQKQISQAQGTASPTALDDLNRKLVAKQREFEDRQRDAKRDFEERQQTLLKEIGDKLNRVITDYADQNRFTAVFILKPNDVAYLANSADITDTVIKLYDEKHPYPPAGAAPKSGS